MDRLFCKHVYSLAFRKQKVWTCQAQNNREIWTSLFYDMLLTILHKLILSLCCRSKDFLCERRDVSLYMYKCIVFSTSKIRYFVKPHCCIDMLSYFLIVKCCLSDLQLAVEFVYCLVLIEVLAKVNKIQCIFTKHLQWSWWK